MILFIVHNLNYILNYVYEKGHYLFFAANRIKKLIAIIAFDLYLFKFLHQLTISYQ